MGVSEKSSLRAQEYRLQMNRLAEVFCATQRHQKTKTKNKKNESQTKVRCHMQNPRWPSLLYCLKCCSRDPLGKQRGGDDGTKQKYRKVHKKIENFSRGTRERAESGRLLYLNQVKVTSSNTTDRACHCLHTTSSAIGIRQNLSRVSYISHENMGNHLQY